VRSCLWEPNDWWLFLEGCDRNPMWGMVSERDPAPSRSLVNLHSTRDRNPAADMDRDYKVTTPGLPSSSKDGSDISDITFRSRPFWRKYGMGWDGMGRDVTLCVFPSIVDCLILSMDEAPWMSSDIGVSKLRKASRGGSPPAPVRYETLSSAGPSWPCDRATLRHRHRGGPGSRHGLLNPRRPICWGLWHW
jgi:hypothetical protein